MKSTPYQSPLAIGFCAGIAPDADESNLTAGESVISRALTKTEEIAIHAKVYHVTPRTISRWIARGLNPADTVAVAQYLTSIIHPSPAALRAVNRILAVELSHLTK